MGDRQKYRGYDKYQSKPRGRISHRDSNSGPYNKNYRTERQNEHNQVGVGKSKKDVFEELRDARRAIDSIKSSLKKQQSSQPYQQYGHPKSYSRDYDYEYRSKNRSSGKQRENRYQQDNTYQDESYASGSWQRRSEKTGYSEGSSSRTINWDNVPKGPDDWQKTQEENSQYSFGKSLMITNDWKTIDLEEATDGIFWELEQKFGHKEFRTFHHGESRWINNSIILGCSANPTQMKELAKAIGLTSDDTTLTELSQTLDSLCGNIRPGPHQKCRYDDPRCKSDPFCVGIEGMTQFVMDLRSAFLAPIPNILINRGKAIQEEKITPWTPFTDEQFAVIKSGLSAMNQYHIALKGGNIIDTDLCCWIRVNEEGKPNENGTKWKAGILKLSKDELYRRQTDMLREGMKKWKEIDWKALARGDGFFSVHRASSAFYLFGGEYSLWMQICLNEQGGLSRENNRKAIDEINNRFNFLRRNDYIAIGQGIADRTGQQLYQNLAQLSKIVDSYAHAYVQCFTRKREGTQTLAEQYAAEFVENNGWFANKTEEMFQKIGGLPDDLASWIKNKIIDAVIEYANQHCLSTRNAFSDLRLVSQQEADRLETKELVKKARDQIKKYFDSLKPKKS